MLVVHYWLEFELPLAACLSVIALSAWLNVAMRMHFRNVQRLAAAAGRAAARLRHRAAHLADDADRRHREPVRVPHSGAGADRRDLAAAALHAAARRVRRRLLDSDRVLFLAAAVDQPTSSWCCRRSTSSAIWIANLVAIVFIGAYAWQVAEEGRLMADALTATELVLAREQHLSQLDGLAAAAAHELGTPLSTISVVAKELQRALGPGFAACRRREAAARAGAALPRDPRQALRAAGRRHAVPAREVLRADRRGGGAASQFRHRDRRRAAAASATASR